MLKASYKSDPILEAVPWAKAFVEQCNRDGFVSWLDDPGVPNPFHVGNRHLFYGPWLPK